MCELNIEDMTLEQKIGHLLVVRGFVDEEDKEFVYEMVKKRAVGGIQMGFTPEGAQFAHKVKSLADYPLLVCADMENGYPLGKYVHPSALALVMTQDSHIAYVLGRLTAKEAIKDGVDIAWGPVLDIAVEGAICKNSRCFGDNPYTVSEYASEYIRGLQDEGMTVTAKHFPGGSDVTYDQHMAKGISKLTEKEYMEKDLIPYIEAMKKVNLTGIMTGHILCEKIDNKYPASLSKKVIDMIRNKGFDGLIVTDSLAMMAIVQEFGDKKAIGLAVAAGNDMVLPNYRLSFKESFYALMNAYENKVFSEERLNEAVRRVLKAQNRSLNKPETSELPESDIELYKKLKDRCIAVNLRDGISAKLEESSKKLFVFLCENYYPELNYECKEIKFETPFSRKSVERIKDDFEKAFPGAETIIMNEFPAPGEIEPVLNAISKADETIFYTFCYSGAYLGTDGLTRRIEYIIKTNQDKISTLIHCGNPYEVKKFKGIKRIIGSVENNSKGILEILKGNFKPQTGFIFDL